MIEIGNYAILHIPRSSVCYQYNGCIGRVYDILYGFDGVNEIVFVTNHATNRKTRIPEMYVEVVDIVKPSDLKAGDTVVLHKPIDTGETPTWVDGSMEPGEYTVSVIGRSINSNASIIRLMEDEQDWAYRSSWFTFPENADVFSGDDCLTNYADAFMSGY